MSSPWRPPPPAHTVRGPFPPPVVGAAEAAADRAARLFRRGQLEVMLPATRHPGSPVSHSSSLSKASWRAAHKRSPPTASYMSGCSA